MIYYPDKIVYTEEELIDMEQKGQEVEQDNADNILEALLGYGQDDLCLEYMGFYKRFLDQDLLLFSLKNNNSTFVKKSLIAGAFDK